MPMRFLFRHFWLPIYRLWVLQAIQRERVFSHAGLTLRIPPGVFHPGLFFSSLIFIDFLQKVDFQDKKVLDIGTGSGLLALFAARKGGVTTALDLHPLAVKTTSQNAAANRLPLQVVQSDLLDTLPPQSFDFVLINPPYYARQAREAAEYAFFAGENMDYFEKLFRQLSAFIHTETSVWMVLSEDCDFVWIQNIAARHQFGLTVVFEQKKWGERFFVAQCGKVY